MNPIEELKQEHEGVLLSLRILEKISQDIEEQKKVSGVETIQELLEFFRIFVDRCHHGKEERLLFPALESLGVGRDGGPIGVMLAEHETGRQHVRDMSDAVGRIRQGDGSGHESFMKNAGEFVELLRLHIEKENQVLFPIGEERFSADRLAELQSGFDRIEADEIGQGRHEAFHEMLHRMEESYLGKA